MIFRLYDVFWKTVPIIHMESWWIMRMVPHPSKKGSTRTVPVDPLLITYCRYLTAENFLLISYCRNSGGRVGMAPFCVQTKALT